MAPMDKAHGFLIARSKAGQGAATHRSTLKTARDQNGKRRAEGTSGKLKETNGCVQALWEIPTDPRPALPASILRLANSPRQFVSIGCSNFARRLTYIWHRNLALLDLCGMGQDCSKRGACGASDCC